MFYSCLYNCKQTEHKSYLFLERCEEKPIYEKACPKCNSMVKAIDITVYSEYPGTEETYLYNIDPETHEQFKKEFMSSQPSQPQQPTKLQIECPYCHNKNCIKIGIIGRGLSFGLFGFGSSKVGKQWHCNTCKSDF